MPKSFAEMIQEAKGRIREIDVAGAAAAVREGGIAIVDVREPDEYRQGHLEGAINIPRGVAEMGIPQLIPDPGTRILCYCAGGGRSALVADNLRQMGYEKIESLTGGFGAWFKAGLPVSR